MSTIPSLVRAIRQRTGQTQDQLAHRLGVSFPTLNAWENGRSAPRARHRDRIVDLARSLDVSLVPLVVLVVDDDPVAVAVLEGLLAGLPHRMEVTTSTDPEQALLVCGLLRPHVLFLDLLMPELDGVEVGRRLRELPGLAHVRVVFVSSSTDRALLERARATDPVAILCKPVSEADLRHVIDEIGAGVGEGDLETGGGPGNERRHVR